MERDVDEPGIDVLPNPKESNFEVFRAGSQVRVVCREHSALVVAHDWNRACCGDAGLVHHVTNPQALVSTERQRYELRLKG